MQALIFYIIENHMKCNEIQQNPIESYKILPNSTEFIGIQDKEIHRSSQYHFPIFRWIF